MANSEVVYCAMCIPHEFQDVKYGFKMRVMNPTGKMEKSGMGRCTCCGSLISLKQGQTKTKALTKSK